MHHEPPDTRPHRLVDEAGPGLRGEGEQVDAFDFFQHVQPALWPLEIAVHHLNPRREVRGSRIAGHGSHPLAGAYQPVHDAATYVPRCTCY